MSDLSITILENGNLRISGSQSDLDDLPCTERATSDHRLAALLEPYWTNGSYSVHTADQFGHMTEAPLIAESADYEDDGTIVLQGRVWWYPDYVVSDPLEVMAEEGHVDFEFAYDSADPDWPSRSIDWSKLYC